MPDPYRRASGRPPFWAPGTPIVWREGSGPLGTGPAITDVTAPHFASPMTVVRDDADALVVWLATGTQVCRAVRADGRGKRDDPATLFTTEIVSEPGTHEMFDQLRVVPTGAPWSVWSLFAAGTGTFAGWYVNLERPHVRDTDTVYTSDHVLDIVVGPDRSVVRKDEHELEIAVHQGVFTSEQAAQIARDASVVEALIAEWAWPFSESWESFRPDPAWPIPALPSR